MLSTRLLLAALALGLVASACTDKSLGSEPSGQGISQYAGAYNITVTPEAKRKFLPSWSGKDFGGNELSSKGVRGSVTVVNFWASWCGPCWAEQPVLESVWRSYRDRGVRFVGVNIRDRRANAEAFITENEVTYPSIYNPDSRVAYRFRTQFVPSTFVLDERGHIAATILGATTSASALGGLIDAELNG